MTPEKPGIYIGLRLKMAITILIGLLVNIVSIVGSQLEMIKVGMMTKLCR